jgi:hypothetical protein
LHSHFPILLSRAPETFLTRNRWICRKKNSHIENYSLKNDAVLLLPVKVIGKLNKQVECENSNVNYDCGAGDKIMIFEKAELSLCLTNYTLRREGVSGRKPIYPGSLDLGTN